MKTHTLVVVILSCFVLALIFPPTVICQLKENKLQRIDREIAEASSNKTSGIYKVVGGVAVTALAFAFIPKDEVRSLQVPPFYEQPHTIEPAKGNATLFLGCLVVGSILEIWGAIEWVDASNSLVVLKTKRNEISFNPTLMPDKKGNLNPGLSLQMNF